MASALERMSTMRAAVLDAVMGHLAGAIAKATPFFPFAAKVVHYGFIPFVILLGMRSEPRPALLDLLTPM